MVKPDRQKFIAGVVLVLFGLGFYMAQKMEALGSEVIMLIIGAAFLVAYFYQKAYGLLVPAGILLGLATGSMLQDRFWWANDGIQLGLGAGFLAIYIIARLYERQSHWWPLIPGGILILIGVPKTREVVRFIGEHWPLILVGVGVLILIGAFRRGAGRPDAAPAAEPDRPAPPAPRTAPEGSSSEGPVEPKIE